MCAAVFAVAVPVNVAAEEPDPPPDPPDPEEVMEWITCGTGTYFEVFNDIYLDITMTSTESVSVILESHSSMVSIHIEADCTETSTYITLTGFVPSNTYYRYQDGYLQESFIANANGEYSFTQDITTPHHVYIRETTSSIFINSDGTIDPATAPITRVGETFTLTANINEALYVLKSGVTLDGGGNTIDGWYVATWGTSGITIQNFNIVNAIYYGVMIWDSNSNIVTGNTISGASTSTGVGIQILGNGNTVSGNTVSTIDIGIRISGSSSSSNTISGNTVSNTGTQGITVWYATIGTDNTISGNTVTDNNRYSIDVGNTQYCTLTGNTVSGGWGIYIGWSTYITVSGNTVTGYPITISQSHHCTVTENTISNSDRSGIQLNSANYNTVSLNTITNSLMDGMRFSWADYNTVFGNTISYNGHYGSWIFDNGINLWLYNDGNRFYHNNILYNTKQVMIYNSGTNYWDNGAGEGNYWGDYTGSDTNGDGIGDTLIPHPYTDQGRGYYHLDNYPLVSPWTANEAPVADAGGPYIADEGSPITFDASGSTDPDGDDLQYRWDFDNDGTWDTSYSITPSAMYTWNDDHSGSAMVEVSDGTVTDTDTASVTVNNVAPTLSLIEGPVDPVQLGTPVDIIGHFSDPGPDDTHTATIDWGDGTLPDTFNIVDEIGGTVTDSYTYSQAGVYIITLTVEDDDTGSDSMEFLYAVIFDPAGGFVTGGGWIDSPPGAHVVNPDDPGGKANFGFVAKYKKGANEPMGNTQFEFEVGDLEFHSASYDWLIITGSKAMFKGTGTVNEVEGYKFMISATDGELEEEGGEDKFRIRIWQEDNLGNENVIYDNGTETPMGGGQIMIHQGK
jgi:parallel beta-helix repeat protein